MPPGLVDDIAQINLPPSSIVEPDLGVGPAPPGVTAEEWKQAADAQQQIDALFAKQPMTAGDIAAAQALEARRNQIWAKAIGNPALTSSQRKQLCMKLPTVAPSPASAPPPLSRDVLDQWNKPIPLPGANPAAHIPVPVMNPVSSWLNGEFAQGQAIGAVEFGGETWADAIIEDSSYGDVLGVAKIAVAYKQEGAASAISEAASYLVGKIPIPQANVAVEGGRIYSGVVFQAQNKFMHDAMAAAGGQFDQEEFWTEFTDGLTTAQKAVKEFISYGP